MIELHPLPLLPQNTKTEMLMLAGGEQHDDVLRATQVWLSLIDPRPGGGGTVGQWIVGNWSKVPALQIAASLEKMAWQKRKLAIDKRSEEVW